MAYTKGQGPTRGSFKKGTSGNVKGRRKGVPNKSTTDLRNFYKGFLEKNVGRMERLLRRVERRDPGEAIKLMLQMTEFCLPKLARVEATGDGGKPIETITRIVREYVAPQQAQPPTGPPGG